MNQVGLAYSVHAITRVLCVTSIPLWPFATFYFAYFAYQGLFSPFWGLYLDSLAFTPWQISVLMSLSTLARLVAPGLWGWLADSLGKRRAIVIFTSICAALAFTLVGLGKAFVWVFVFMAVSHFFWAASLPLVEASTAHLTRAQPGKYSRVRVWGSIGFVVLSISGGYILDNIGLVNLPWAVALLLGSVAIASVLVPDIQVEKHTQQVDSMLVTLRQPKVIALFTCCFLMAFAHGPYYTFYSIGLKLAGYDKAAIGWLWSVGVICEILIFLCMPKIMGRFSLEKLMTISLLAAVVRFCLISTAIQFVSLAVIAQMLHALTFALHHATSVGLINRLFLARHQARSQGLYIIASFGIGGSSGGLLGGLLWPHGERLLTFGISVVAALLGVWVSVVWLNERRPRVAS